MTSYTIRHTCREDIPSIMKIYEAAKKIMRKDGNMNQWINGYPSKEILEEDIRRNVSYVVTQNKLIVATFACIPGEDPTYKKIYEGRWLNSILDYVTIHRLGSLPEYHGIAISVFDFVSKLAPSIRIDTHQDNHIMKEILVKNGFTYCGIIFLANNDKRLAYQKIN